MTTTRVVLPLKEFEQAVPLATPASPVAIVLLALGRLSAMLPGKKEFRRTVLVGAVFVYKMTACIESSRL